MATTPKSPPTPNTPSSPGTLRRENSKKDAGVFGWMGTLSRRKKDETEGNTTTYAECYLSKMFSKMSNRLRV